MELPQILKTRARKQREALELVPALREARTAHICAQGMVESLESGVKRAQAAIWYKAEQLKLAQGGASVLAGNSADLMQRTQSEYRQAVNEHQSLAAALEAARARCQSMKEKRFELEKKFDECGLIVR